MPQPVLVEADINNGVEAAQWLMPDFSRNDVFYLGSANDRRPTTDDCGAHVHIEIKNLFPHRHQKHQMPLLARVLLRDLQFDCLTRVRHAAEQRRSWLAHLKINWPVLDLNDDIVFELPIERMKVVVRRTR